MMQAGSMQSSSSTARCRWTGIAAETSLPAPPTPSAPGSERTLMYNIPLPSIEHGVQRLRSLLMYVFLSFVACAACSRNMIFATARARGVVESLAQFTIMCHN